MGKYWWGFNKTHGLLVLDSTDVRNTMGSIRYFRKVPSWENISIRQSEFETTEFTNINYYLASLSNSEKTSTTKLVRSYYEQLTSEGKIENATKPYEFIENFYRVMDLDTSLLRNDLYSALIPHQNIIMCFLAWRILDAPDYFGESLISFKNNEAAAISLWSTIATDILQHSIIGTRQTFILTALSSRETSISTDSPLYKLCDFISSHNNYINVCDKLSKTKNPSLHTLHAGNERDKTISGSYTCLPIPGLTSEHDIIVLDDLMTRGSTFAEIARAILETNPQASMIKCIALGKNERSLYQHGSNDHLREYLA